jgi:hypothetical protein
MTNQHALPTTFAVCFFLKRWCIEVGKRWGYGQGLGMYPVGGSEAGDAGGEVDDIAAGPVDDAPLPEEAAAPEGEGADGVGAGEPEGDEEHPGAEAHAAEDGAGEEDEGDGGEDELEVDLGGHGEEGRHGADVGGGAGGQRGLREQVLVAERGAGLAPDRDELLPERHLVRPPHPAQQHRRERVERHERRVHGPLLLHNAPVKNHQRRHRLHPHQRRRRQLPCVVALVQPVRVHPPERLVVRRRNAILRHLDHPLANSAKPLNLPITPPKPT